MDAGLEDRMLGGRSPGVGRRLREEDRSNLIGSPTESEAGSLELYAENGNEGIEFVPKTTRIGALNQVVQSLRLSGAKSYSGLGSCPNLAQQPARPLLARTLIDTDSTKPNEDVLTTPYGTVHVSKRGNPRGPALITCHDLGLNHVSNFQTFFNCPAMAAVTSKFCIYHITATGQEQGATELPADFSYPTMDQLSEMVEYVCHNYGIPHFVGLGVGLGANILVRLALRRPKLVDGMVLINCTSSSSGWLEWAYHKMNMKNLRKSPVVPESVVEYLVWYHLGSLGGDRSIDSVSLASILKQHFIAEVNPVNLALLIQAYVTRTDIKLARDLAANGKTMLGSNRTLKMPVLNMVGDHSPHIEATVNFNGRLDPAKCTWMKIQDAGMVLEEQPEKAGEAIRLFLQGLGYTLRNGRSRSVCEASRKLSLNITANDSPISVKKLQQMNLNEDLIF